MLINHHHNGYEDNADAHLKRTIMGREVVVAVTDEKLDFSRVGTTRRYAFGDRVRPSPSMVKAVIDESGSPHKWGQFTLTLPLLDLISPKHQHQFSKYKLVHQSLHI